MIFLSFFNFCNFLFEVHKQRDLVPLDVNGGTDDSDEDDEVPVFDFEVFLFWPLKLLRIGSGYGIAKLLTRFFGKISYL